MSFRGFLAVEVGATPGVRNLQRELEATGADLNLVDLEDLHVTLKFLGPTDLETVPTIVDAMEDAVDGIEARTLHLEDVGVFPHEDHMRVLWVGVREDDPVRTVAERLEADLEPLGFEPEDRDYHAHVTVARVRSGRAKDRLRALLREHDGEAFGDVDWARIVLMRSDLGPDGPTYSVVETVPLEG